MIPKLAHVIWIGKPMPEPLRELVRGFEELHPDWELCWWDERALAELDMRNRSLYDNAERYVPADSVCQFRSDLARYEILRDYGGLYIDCDYRWQRSITDLSSRAGGFLSAWEIEGQFVANGVIGATPQHPVLLDMIDAVHASCTSPKNNGWRSNRLTGTHVFTPIVRKHGAYVAPQHLFHPARWNQVELTDDKNGFPDSIAVHMWNHQREIRGLPL